MQNFKNALMAFTILLVIGGTGILFLKSKETAHAPAANLMEQGSATTTATTSRESDTENVVLEERISFPIDTWTRGEERGVLVDYGEVVVTDLRPYTSKSLKLSVSSWPQPDSQLAESDGEIRFDRTTGVLFFEPAREDGKDTYPLWDETRFNSYMKFARREKDVDVAATIMQMSTSGMEAYFRRYEPDSPKKVTEIEAIKKYCEARLSETNEGVGKYQLFETDEYKNLPVEQKIRDPFGPCSFSSFYVYEDFIIEKYFFRRQDGTAIDSFDFQ
jgi:hypothetical protein